MRVRCSVCGRPVNLSEFFSGLRERRRLTYPSRRPDGARFEYAVRYLCGKCEQRAAQHREGPLLVSSPPSRSSRDQASNASVMPLLKLGAGAALIVALGGGSLALLTRPPQRFSARKTSQEVPPPAPTRSGSAVALPHPAALPSAPRRFASPRLVVRVSTTTPQRSRGFWITVAVAPALHVPGVRPTIRFQDANGRRYRLTLNASSRPGEWTRQFGLDEVGPWQGVVSLQAGEQKLNKALPLIHVLP